MCERELTRINRHVGEGIRLARIVRQVSVAELAERTGISEPQLLRMEGGLIEASGRELLALGEALGVSVNFFFHGLDDADNATQGNAPALLERLLAEVRMVGRSYA